MLPSSRPSRGLGDLHVVPCGLVPAADGRPHRVAKSLPANWIWETLTAIRVTCADADS